MRTPINHAWDIFRPGIYMAIAIAVPCLVTMALMRSVFNVSWPAIAAAGLVTAVATAGIVIVQTVISNRVTKRLAELESAIDTLPKMSGENDEEPRKVAFASGIIGRIVRAEIRVRAAQRAARSIAVEREQAQAQLAQMTNERSEFFSRLSHELRSPLNAILGYSAILSEETLMADQKHLHDDLGRIKQAGSELLGLIDHLLSVADDRSGKASIDRVPFDLGAGLATLVDNLKKRELKIDLPVQCQSGPTVYGNRDKIFRAVNGLIDHAFRESPECHLTITSELFAGAPAEVHIHVDFDVLKVAGEGARVPATMVRNLADTLARNVGGQLSFQTTPDDRQRFTLAFPVDCRAIKVNEMEKEMGNAVPTEAAPEEQLKRLALVIDDDPAAVDLLSRWLNRSGYAVVSATDAGTGLALAHKHVPDIVLLDALMPGKTGYDLLPEIRAIPELKLVPVVIVTVDDDRARGLEAGASDFVRKPVNETAMRELLKVYEHSSTGDILIIDDDDDAAELLDRNVRRLGFETRRAANGEEGLAAVRERMPSAILLDLNMPKVNGFDFIDAIVSEKQFASIPMLVVSGEDLSLPQHHKLAQAGCRFYLKGNAAPREIAEGLREAVG